MKTNHLKMTVSKKTNNQPYAEEDEAPPKDGQHVYSDDQLSETIDELLKTMDLNKDGYIEYTEYKNSL